jgi:hypothetical protein
LVPLADIIADPGWFPTGLSHDYRTMRFGCTSRDALAREAFLDQRMEGAISDVQDCPVDDLVAQCPDTSEQLPTFVFHSAFCCSTLLARALDVPGQCLALKEPDILMGLANAIRLQKDSSANASLARTIVALLSRRFDESEPILIKPTNAANNLLPGVLDLGARTLILYSDLRSFLVSVIKKGEACKAFMRTQYNIFSLDDGGLAGIPPRQAMTFTDLQVAALVWRHQLEWFERELAGRSADSIASLDFRILVDGPAATLEAVSRHLGLSHDRPLLDEIAAGPVFTRNSKFSDQAYDTGQRNRDEVSIAEQHVEALEQVEEWAKTLNLGTDFSLPLSKSLDVPD